MRLINTLGSLFGLILYWLVPIRKRLIVHNLTEAYKNELSAKAIRKLVIKNYQNYATIFFELLLFRRKKDYRKYMTIKNKQVVEAALTKGKGILFVGTHMGNWEIVINSCFLINMELHFVVKQIKSAFGKWFFKLFRVKSGLKLIHAEKTYDKILSLLAQNKIVGFAMDQHNGSRGVFVEFYGRLAATNTSLVSLALKSGATVIPVHEYRRPDGKGFVIEFEKPIEMVNTPNLDFNIFYNTQIITKRIESWIRKFPDQWFWGHKRWKGQYEGKQPIVPVVPFTPAAFEKYLQMEI